MKTNVTYLILRLWLINEWKRVWVNVDQTSSLISFSKHTLNFITTLVKMNKWLRPCSRYDTRTIYQCVCYFDYVPFARTRRSDKVCMVWCFSYCRQTFFQKVVYRWFYGLVFFWLSSNLISEASNTDDSINMKKKMIKTYF